MREFEYNENKELASINDRFGNQTTIERDENGVPISITSPDGLTNNVHHRRHESPLSNHLSGWQLLSF